MSSHSQITYARVKGVLMLGMIRTSVGLAIMWALLAVVVLWPRDYQPIELGFSQQEQAINSARALAASSILAPDFESAAIMRPLFVEGRNPIQADAEVVVISAPLAEEESADIAGYSLVGVFGSGAQAGAMLVDAAGEVIRVSVSNSLSKWELIEVGQRSATFQKLGNTEVRVLNLPIHSVDSGAVSTAGPVATAPTGVSRSRTRSPPGMRGRNVSASGSKVREARDQGGAAAPTFDTIEAQRRAAIEADKNDDKVEK